MPVRYGTLLLGASPVGAGLNGAVRGFADLDGTEEPVIAKQIPIPEILGEIFCALLCRSLDLPAPEPLLLKNQETGLWMFGSIDLAYPNCSQFLMLDASNQRAYEKSCFIWSQFLSKWPSLPKTIAFDEWVNNKDRNPGNLLWQDENEFALIDHGRALNLDPSSPDENKLVSFWLLSAQGDELAHRRIMTSAKTFAQRFDTFLPRGAASEMENLGQAALTEAFINFLDGRLHSILCHITSRFPVPSQKELPV
ncbi:MAG: hypothetical protein P4L50_00625 [Anaerolineaceae bacterium]|nr:hypothetical protein [Anaerolineaceae bacterium]